MRQVLTQIGDLLDRVDAGGWALLCAGLAAIGVALLMPAADELDVLRQQQAVLERQVTALEMTCETHHAFAAAVQGGDPALIRRLAWRQLNLKPAGTQFLHASIAVEQFVDDRPVFACPPSALPVVPPFMAAPQPPDTMLYRLVSGPNRVWMLCGGVVLAMFGLLSSIWLRDDTERGRAVR